MSDLLAVSNNDLEIEVRPSLLPTPAIATPNNGSATPVSPALFGIDDIGKTEDDKVKINEDKVLKNLIQPKIPGIPPVGGAATDFSCAPLGVSPFTWITGGIYVVLSGSLKVKCSNISAMLENDSTVINCTCSGTDSTTPTPISFTGSCSVKISKAGQDKVKGE